MKWFSKIFCIFKGEDTEQMSAAGQMETFLGVSGIEEVMKIVFYDTNFM